MADFQETLAFSVLLDATAAEQSLLLLQDAFEETGNAADTASAEMTAGLDAAGESAQGAGDQMEGMASSSGGAAQGARSLATALSALNPELGRGAILAYAVGRGLKALGAAAGLSTVALGPLAVAIGIVAAATYYASQVVEEAEAAQSKMNEEATRAQAIFERLKGAVSAVEDEYAILTGTTDSLALRFQRQQQELDATYRATIRSQQASIDATRDKIAALAAEGEMTEELAAKIERLKSQRQAQQAILDGSIARQEEMNEKLRESEELIRAEREAEDANRRAAAAAAAAEARRRAAAAAAAAAAAEAEREERERARLAAEGQAALDKLELDNMRLKGDQIGILNMQYQAQLEAIDALAARHAEAGVEFDIQAHKELALENHRLEMMQLRDDMEKTIEEHREAAHAEEMRRQEEQRAAQMQTMTVSSELFSNLSQGFLSLSQSQAEAGSAAAIKSFEIARKLATAEVIFSTAKGLMEAALLPPPANFIKGAAISALSAAQLAAIAAQKPPEVAHMGDTGLHQGRSASGSGQTTVILNNEAVLDSATTRRLGPEGVQGLLNGADPGQGSAPVVVSYRHLDQAVGDLLNNGKSRTARGARSARSASSIGTSRAY